MASTDSTSRTHDGAPGPSNDSGAGARYGNFGRRRTASGTRPRAGTRSQWPSRTTVASGATLDLRNVASVPENITLNGGTLQTSTGTSSLSGNVTLAARKLGVSRDTLRYRMEKYGIRGEGLA